MNDREQSLPENKTPLMQDQAKEKTEHIRTFPELPPEPHMQGTRSISALIRSSPTGAWTEPSCQIRITYVSGRYLIPMGAAGSSTIRTTQSGKPKPPGGTDSPLRSSEPQASPFPSSFCEPGFQ